MKRIAIGIVIISMVLIFLSMQSPAYQLAVRRAGSGGWGATTQYGHKFDPGTVETIKGEVVSVRKFVPLRSMAFGYLVTVKTEEETIPVHLGPGYYVDRSGFELAPNDSVEVTGSRILFHGESAIIATQVKKGDETLTLRTQKGIPVWSDYYKKQEGS